MPRMEHWVQGLTQTFISISCIKRINKIKLARKTVSQLNLQISLKNVACAKSEVLGKFMNERKGYCHWDVEPQILRTSINM